MKPPDLPGLKLLLTSQSSRVTAFRANILPTKYSIPLGIVSPDLTVIVGGSGTQRNWACGLLLTGRPPESVQDRLR